MKFEYTALTRDNKKITGVLDVETKELVDEELHKMGLAIISINEISDEQFEKLKQGQAEAKAEKGIRTFTFLAIDKNGKEVEGTIDSLDDYSAYKRLQLEYQLKVNNLYLATASDTEIKQAKIKLQYFEDNLKKELSGLDIKKEQPEELVEIDKKFITEIDSIIGNTKEILKTHQALFNNELLQDIKKVLEELEKIRTSNNIKHISDVSKRLYDLISNPNKLDNKADNTDYQKIISNIEKQSFIQKEMGLYKKIGGTNGLKKIFRNIGERLKLIKKKNKNTQHSADANVQALNIVTKQTAEASTTQSLEADDYNLPEESEITKKPKKDFTYIFAEINSFIGWLLCFYIVYFFIASFAIEKNIGFGKNFIFETLKSPLVLNITIFLLFLHFILKIRNAYFKHNIIATLFLIFLNLGIYILLVVNF